MNRILLVDDDLNVLEGLKRALRGADLEVFSAHSAEEALRLLSTQRVDAVVSDHRLTGMTGLEFLKQVKRDYPNTTRLLLTGHGNLDLAHESIKDQTVFRFFTKPCNALDLAVTIQQGIYQKTLERENRVLSQAISNSVPCRPLVEFSWPMKALSKQIRQISALDTSVLIRGESGTGKTTLARQIHQMGRLASRPFVTISCAALPRELIEAELFGYERGAFTGAVASRPGRVELADGGTLFLDEIGDMPLELQPKLLTFLDDRILQRLGGTHSRKVNIRIIAATNQNLENLCRQKQFREDLYFRLNVLSIQIPPLRDRREDILPIADGILHRIVKHRGERPIKISVEVQSDLVQYSWPGNVRELENLLERACALCTKSTITRDDISMPEGRHEILSGQCHTYQNQIGIMTLAEMERNAISTALEVCQGNKAAAARRLGISEKSIYNKMKRLGIPGFR